VEDFRSGNAFDGLFVTLPFPGPRISFRYHDQGTVLLVGMNALAFRLPEDAGEP
jgi:hypothetical protein